MSVPLRFDQLDSARQHKIRANLTTMQQHGASDDEIDTYLRDGERLAPTGTAAPAPPSERMTSGVNAPSNAFARFVEEVPFVTKASAGASALTTKILDTFSPSSVPSEFRGKGLGELYRTNYNASEAAIERYRREHPTRSTIAAGAGMLAPALLSLGGTTAEQLGAKGAEKVPLLTKMAQGAKVGAGYGALQGASHAQGGPGDYAREIATGAGAGAAGGAILTPPAEYLTGKAAQGLGAAAGLAGKHLDPESALARLVARLSGATGKSGRAAERLARAVEADQAAGFVPQDEVQGIPLMALDRGGPAVQGTAEGIAQRPGAGRSIFTKALEGRQAATGPATEQFIEQATGVSAPQAKALRPLRNLIAQGKTAMDEAFGKAREATVGRTIDSPTVRAIDNTPVGKDAFAWAKAQKANRMSPLPTVERPPPLPDELRAAGVSEENWQKSLETMKARGIPPPKGTTEELYDPETLHYAKQYLAKVARLGTHDGQGGTLATQAQSALGLWGKVRAEMGPEFQAADQIATEHFKRIEMANRGRKVFRTPVNPGAKNAKAAVQQSLDQLQQDIATSDEAGQAAARAGGAIAMHARLGEATNVTNPEKLFFGSAQRAAQTGTALPSPEATATFRQQTGALSRLNQQADKILKGSQTAYRAAEHGATEPDVGPGVLRSLVHGNVGQAASQVASQGSRAAAKLSTQQEDAIIARWLTSPEAKVLPDAVKTAILRRTARGSARVLLPKMLGTAAGSTATRQ